MDSIAAIPAKGKKKSAGSELAQEMKKWNQRHERDYKERDMPQLGSDAPVLRKMKELYPDQLGSFSYRDHRELIVLLRTKSEEYARYTGAEWFIMMEEGNPKF